MLLRTHSPTLLVVGAIAWVWHSYRLVEIGVSLQTIGCFWRLRKDSIFRRVGADVCAPS